MNELTIFPIKNNLYLINLIFRMHMFKALIKPLHKMELKRNGKIEFLPFFLKVEMSTKICFVSSHKLSARPRNCWSLYPKASFLDQIKMKKPS